MEPFAIYFTEFAEDAGDEKGLHRKGSTNPSTYIVKDEFSDPEYSNDEIDSVNENLKNCEQTMRTGSETRLKKIKEELDDNMEIPEKRFDPSDMVVKAEPIDV